jgi:hypothetical protein
MEEWFIIQSFCHGLIRSAREHIDDVAGGSFFALSIEEARKMVEKMVSNQSWDDERTQASMLGGTNPVSHSTTTNKVV